MSMQFNRIKLLASHFALLSIFLSPTLNAQETPPDAGASPKSSGKTIGTVSGTEHSDSNGDVFLQLTFTSDNATEIYKLDKAKNDLVDIPALPAGVKQMGTVTGQEFEGGEFEIETTNSETGEKATIKDNKNEDASGSTPAPAGTVPSDTPTPPASTDTPPADTATPPADAGTPPADTATPPADSATPPADAATPPSM